MDSQLFKLRPLQPKDADRMVEMMHDAQTIRYLQIGGPNYTKETALRFIEHSSNESENLHRAVVDSNDVYQGTISLKNIDPEKMDAEYAISMHPDVQGKGAAKAATELILKVAFEEKKLQTVYLNVLDINIRANKFYLKNGFRYTHSTTMVFDNEEQKLNWYSIKNG